MWVVVGGRGGQAVAEGMLCWEFVVYLGGGLTFLSAYFLYSRKAPMDMCH